jgi:hypothetical protein
MLGAPAVGVAAMYLGGRVPPPSGSGRTKRPRV